MDIPQNISFDFMDWIECPDSKYIDVLQGAANGTISPSPSVTVVEGGTATFVMTPATGYQIGELKIDNVVTSIQNPYVFTNVTANHTISVKFIPLPVGSYTITTSITKGTITPSFTVTAGETAVISFTPFQGNAVRRVRINNVPQSNLESPVVIENVQGNYNVSVECDSSGGEPPATHTVTSLVQSGSGTISPTPTVTVNHGSSATFTMAPTTGNTISLITVDGASVGHTNSTHKISNITTDHTIAVTFTPIIPPQTFTLTVTNTYRGAYPGDSAWGTVTVTDGSTTLLSWGDIIGTRTSNITEGHTLQLNVLCHRAGGTMYRGLEEVRINGERVYAAFNTESVISFVYPINGISGDVDIRVVFKPFTSSIS